MMLKNNNVNSNYDSLNTLHFDANQMMNTRNT